MGVSFNTILNNLSEDNCGFCLDPLNNGKIVVVHDGSDGKKHPIHRECIRNWLNLSARQVCPYCERMVNTESLYSLEERRIQNLAQAAIKSPEVEMFEIIQRRGIRVVIGAGLVIGAGIGGGIGAGSVIVTKIGEKIGIRKEARIVIEEVIGNAMLLGAGIGARIGAIIAIRTKGIARIIVGLGARLVIRLI